MAPSKETVEQVRALNERYEAGFITGAALPVDGGFTAA